jgi:hypothetical protein
MYNSYNTAVAMNEPFFTARARSTWHDPEMGLIVQVQHSFAAVPLVADFASSENKAIGHGT